MVMSGLFALFSGALSIYIGVSQKFLLSRFPYLLSGSLVYTMLWGRRFPCYILIIRDGKSALAFYRVLPCRFFGQ